MKLNLILGKKQIVLASLVLILGAAIYLNYSFSKESSPTALPWWTETAFGSW